VTGTGFSDDEVTRQYSIAQAFFNLPKEEKDKAELRCDFGKGNYFGFRAVSSSPSLGANHRALLTTKVGGEESDGNRSSRQRRKLELSKVYPRTDSRTSS
jgi:isopenicillin N synthase-like dioxygenase